MKKIQLILILQFVSTRSFAQQQHKPDYGQLRVFEGIYEYTNNTTLAIAASPKDTLLYALINKSSYPLKPVGDNIFVNVSNEKIRFLKNSLNEVTGYVVEKDTFKLLSRNVRFPKEIWYPRLSGNSAYKIPDNLKYGLKTGNIARKIIDGTYQHVHSVLIIKDNKLVFEEYFYEYTRDSLQEMRSATKSLVSALTGIAIDKGFIKSKNETALSYFPEYTLNNMSDAKNKLQLKVCFPIKADLIVM